MKNFSLQFKVLLIAAAALAVALGASLLTLTSVYDSIRDLDRITHEEFRSQRAILQATVAYKQRVQEWKDTLLKGADPASAEKQHLSLSPGQLLYVAQRSGGGGAPASASAPASTTGHPPASRLKQPKLPAS